MKDSKHNFEVNKLRTNKKEFKLIEVKSASE